MLGEVLKLQLVFLVLHFLFLHQHILLHLNLSEPLQTFILVQYLQTRHIHLDPLLTPAKKFFSLREQGLPLSPMIFSLSHWPWLFHLLVTSISQEWWCMRWKLHFDFIDDWLVGVPVRKRIRFVYTLVWTCRCIFFLMIYVWVIRLILLVLEEKGDIIRGSLFIACWNVIRIWIAINWTPCKLRGILRLRSSCLI